MSDGYFTVGGLIKLLAEAYDVIAITDHNHLTNPHPLQLQDAGDLLILRGIELTFPSLHMVCIEPIDTSSVINILKSARLSWLAHPCYQVPKMTDMIEVVRRNYLDGVELYNSGELVFPKQDIDLWPYNFYAGDDLHVSSQLCTSWMEMEVKDKHDKDEIIEKLVAGEHVNRRNPMDPVDRLLMRQTVLGDLP